MGTLSRTNPQGLTILILCSIFAGLAVITVGLRLWSRRLKKQKLCLNDYSVLIALLFSMALIGILAASVSVGLGRHIVEVELRKIPTFLKLEIALSSTWIVTLTAVKISILDLYIKIFRIKQFIRVVWGFIILQVVFCIVVLLQIFLICRPLALYWDRTLKGTCGNATDAYLSHHIIILILDISIAILPMPVLWRLKMPTSKKIGISFLFSIGITICIISLIRIVWVHRVGQADITYNWAVLYLFTTLEPLLGIVVACLPLIQPVVNKVSLSSVMIWSRCKLKSTWGNSKPSQQGSSGSNSMSSDRKKFSRPVDHMYKADGTDKLNSGVETHSFDDLEAQSDLTPISKPSQPHTIQVTSVWNVRSAPSQ